MKAVYLWYENISYDAAKQRFLDADQWAQSSCSTYKGYRVVDVSDVSCYFDEVAEYCFDSDQDATLFVLRWS